MMNIRLDDLSHPAVAELLTDHLRNMHGNSPPESVHALDLDALRAPDICFWTLWNDDGEVMGCCALKDLGDGHGEIKSMKTSPLHLRKGVAAALMEHLMQQAQEKGFSRLSLETGSIDYFKPAHRLYERYGFEYCGPFADYEEDAFSVFMTRPL